MIFVYYCKTSALHLSPIRTYSDRIKTTDLLFYPPAPYSNKVFQSGLSLPRVVAVAPNACVHAENRVGMRGGMCSVDKPSRKPRDSISHIAPRPMIFPTADRRRKPSLYRGKERIACRLEATPSEPSRFSGRAAAPPPGLSSSILFWSKNLLCTSTFFFSLLYYHYYFLNLYTKPERDLVTFPVSQLPHQVAASPGTAAYVLFEPRRLTPALSSRARC